LQWCSGVYGAGCRCVRCGSLFFAVSCESNEVIIHRKLAYA
jgi:hypothetical protein